jgi:hypothetical protein
MLAPNSSLHWCDPWRPFMRVHNYLHKIVALCLPCTNVGWCSRLWLTIRTCRLNSYAHGRRSPPRAARHYTIGKGGVFCCANDCLPNVYVVQPYFSDHVPRSNVCVCVHSCTHSSTKFSTHTHRCTDRPTFKSCNYSNYTYRSSLVYIGTTQCEQRM